VSLAVAVPFGIAAACVYGTSIVIQHRSANEHGGGDASASGLLRLLKEPLWVMAVLGDFIGFVLQGVALSAGQVIYIQPLVVLMLPVALLVHWYQGGPRPSRGDVLGVLAILGGLVLFLALVGEPTHQRVPHSRYVGMAVMLVLLGGVLLCLVVNGFRAAVRGAVYGAVAGAYFGTIAVLVDGSSDVISRRGFDALFTTPRGIVLLAGICLLGIAGIIVTQISFQVGTLAATLPANLAADPLFAVFLGVVLLHEHVPMSPGHVIAYLVSLVAIVAGAIRLAAPAIAPVPGHAHAHQDEPTGQ
jgi:drug/metabolite transporter (DMT)-like permease